MTIMHYMCNRKMASQGIGFASFLAYGLLLQVCCGQNAKYGTLNRNQNRYKQHTTEEPNLGAFDGVKTTDIPEEIQMVNNSSSIVKGKLLFAQEKFNYVINAEKRNMSRLMKQGVTRVQETARSVNPYNIIAIRTHALKGNGWKGQVQLNSFLRVNKDNDFRKQRNSRKRDEIKGKILKDGGNVDENKMSAKETEKHKTETQVGIVDKSNTTAEKFEPITNSRPQIRTTTASQLGNSDKVNTTVVPGTFEPITNNQLQKRTATKSQLGKSDRVNATNAPETFEPINNQPQTGTTTEPQLGIFDRINTADVPEEFEPVTNYEGIVINKPVQGQEMYNDIITLIPKQIAINRENINDESLSQTLMTTKPSQDAVVKSNATVVTNKLEPATNITQGITNQSISGLDVQNHTLDLGHRDLGKLFKQGIGKVEREESTVKGHNLGARRINAFKGKAQQQLYSVLVNNQVNDLPKMKISRERGERKRKESYKKFKKY